VSRNRTPLIIAPAVLVAAAALAQTPAGHAVLRAAGLEKAPPSYATLSFAQPQSLPAQLPAPRTTVHVSFTIRNDSADTHSYFWSLSATHTSRLAGGPAARPVSGSTTLAPDATATLDPALPLSCTGGQLRVTIHLASPAESIDFLANCPAPKKRAR
jgi:hypothetical protein